MTDWKTTIAGLVTAVATLLAHFSIVIPESWQSFIIAIGIGILGLFSAQAGKETPK